MLNGQNFGMYSSLQNVSQQYNVWLQASNVKFELFEFTFVETSGVPLDNFEWFRYFRAFSVVLVVDLYGGLAMVRAASSRAVILASCSLFDSNYVAMSVFIFSVVSVAPRGGLFSLISLGRWTTGLQF